MIYDCFSYWDEDLLLDLRLNILDKIVDRFVIVEGDKTWQNNPKKLKFDIKKFQKFKDKIIYIPVTDLPDGEDPYLRENHQRNSISKGIKDANEDDIIFNESPKAVVDSESIKYLRGAEIEWQKEAFSGQMVVNNPGAKMGCGCGSSFMYDFELPTNS